MTIKKIARFISLAALFLIPAFPFIFPTITGNGMFFPFITGKAFYFRILIEIGFAAWVILAFLDARYRPRLNALTVGVSLFALITLAADLLGVSPIRSLWSNFERMEGWITIIHLWAFYMFAVNVFGPGEEGRRWWHRFFNAELFVAFLVSMYGLFQLFHWADIHQGSSRIDASLGNAAYMAVYMLLNAGIAAYMTFVARRREIANAGFLSWAYPILALLFSYEVFETATRGTILGLIGGAMLALFIYAVLGKNQPKKFRMGAGIALIAIIVVGGIFWSVRHAAFVQNSEVLSRLANISINDVQTQARAYVWPMALKGFSQRPVLGWGQENFNYIFNANYNPLMWQQEQWFDRAHSVYLDWLTASGIIGLMAYLALYALFLTGVWKSTLSFAEKSVLTGLLAGYAVHNVFVFDNLASYFLFFTVLGFVASFRQDKKIAWFGTASVAPEAVEYVVAPITVVALVAVLYFFNVRPIQANQDLIAGLESCAGPQPTTTGFVDGLTINTYVANQEIREQLISCTLNIINQQQIPPTTKENFYELTVKGITDQMAATPIRDARIYSLGGSFYNSLAQYDKAEALLEIAHELSPGKQSIDLELANAEINTGKADKAVAILGPAYESAPKDDQVANVYALALVVDNKEVTALQMFGNRPDIFQTPGMAQAYTYIKNYPKAIAIYQALLAKDTSNVNVAVPLAQTQYMSGQKAAAIATLRAIEEKHPEYKQQLDAAIAQIQSGK